MLKIKKEYEFEKTGMNEVVGLEKTLQKVLKPIQKALQDKIYWDTVSTRVTEYKSRDGFIAHSHNHGGLELCYIIPKCEEYSWNTIEFGEYETDQDAENDNEGHYDAKIRIWLKFEGIDDAGYMQFYLVMSGGNNDAPYFREAHSGTYFGAEFKSKTLKGIDLVAKKHINKLLKLIK